MMFETQKGDYFKVSDLTREQYDDLRLLYNQKITDSATVHLYGNIWNMRGWSYVGWDEADEWDCWSDSDMYEGRLLTYEQVFPNVAVEDAEPTLQQKTIQEQIEDIEAKLDAVNHPTHYTSHPNNIECIDITEHMNFCVGNAVKYLWRSGKKGDEIEDLRKAAWYIQREIERLEKLNAKE